MKSSPDNESVPDSTHFDPCCPVNNLQNDLADSLDDDYLPDHLSQIDPLEITLHNGIPNDNNTDLPDLIISSSTDSYDDREPDSPHSMPGRPNRVRFRSRVRIASGLNRHRHSLQGVDYLSPDYSPESSISGSPSSSISVPLRTHTDEQVGKPGWGTLGQRVSLFARGQMDRSRRCEQKERPGLGASSFGKGVGRGGGEALVIPYYAQITEETPLLMSSARNGSCSDLSRENEASQLAREIDMVFGPWPGRLANYHVSFIPVLTLNPLIRFLQWWWWQVESVICCRCVSDLDDEG